MSRLQGQVNMTAQSQITGTRVLRPIVPQPRRVPVPAPVAAAALAAAEDHASCRSREAAYLARVEAGGTMAVARAAARYPFAAPFRIPAAAQDIIREAMAARVPAGSRPKPDTSARNVAQQAERAAQIDKTRALLAEGAKQKDIMRLLGITQATARQYIMAAKA